MSLQPDVNSQTHADVAILLQHNPYTLILKHVACDLVENKRLNPLHLNLPVHILGFKHGSQLSVKSPPRQPAVESIKTSRTAPANHGNPPGLIKNIQPASQPGHTYVAVAFLLISEAQFFFF